MERLTEGLPVGDTDAPIERDSEDEAEGEGVAGAVWAPGDCAGHAVLNTSP